MDEDQGGWLGPWLAVCIVGTIVMNVLAATIGDRATTIVAALTVVVTAFLMVVGLIVWAVRENKRS